MQNAMATFTAGMTSTEYTINRENHKHQWFGIAGTAVFHGVIILFLVFNFIYPPNPPLEYEGMMMSLGEENMGGPADAPVPDPAQQEQYVPISEQTEETPITADNGEEVSIKEKTTPKTNEIKDPRPVTETTKPVLDLPKKVNQQALFKKNQGAKGGFGDGENPGNEGEPDGSPDGNPDGHGLGDSGFGNSDRGPDGISIDLGGRKVRQLPEIEDNSRSVGKVVVSIVVNRDGEVIKAVPGQVGSTTTEPSLLSKAKEGALKTRFVARGDGPAEQYGTMTIIFRYRP